MIPLFKPFMPETPLLDEILRSGKLSYGQYVKEFEKKLKAYFNVKYLMVTNTFSSAISVVLTTKGITAGDEVIASPMGCLVSTQPYVANGLKVVWADVDPKTGTLYPDRVKEKISVRTKAIIHNHFCGYVGYMDEINSIGQEFGIPVIDDGIECFGSEYKGLKVGATIQDVVIFSLSAVRIPNTIEGGIIIFKEEKDYEKALRIRDCGIDRTCFRDVNGEISLECDISEIGYSAMMSDVNGYIGCQQMQFVDELIDKQRQQAKKWDEYFLENKIGTPIINKNCTPNYWVYGMLAKEKVEAIKTFRELGYYASGVHIKNNIYSVFGNKETLKGVDEFYSHFVALPCGWWMTDGK